MKIKAEEQLLPYPKHIEINTVEIFKPMVHVDSNTFDQKVVKRIKCLT